MEAGWTPIDDDSLEASASAATGDVCVVWVGDRQFLSLLLIGWMD